MEVAGISSSIEHDQRAHCLQNFARYQYKYFCKQNRSLSLTGSKWWQDSCQMFLHKRSRAHDACQKRFKIYWCYWPGPSSRNSSILLTICVLITEDCGMKPRNCGTRKKIIFYLLDCVRIWVIFNLDKITLFFLCSIYHFVIISTVTCNGCVGF